MKKTPIKVSAYFLLFFSLVYIGCDEVACDPDPLVVTWEVEDQSENKPNNVITCDDEYVCICFCNCINGKEDTYWEAKLLYQGTHVISVFKKQVGTLDQFQDKFKVPKSVVKQGKYSIQIDHDSGQDLRLSNTFEITCN